jgi:hypothetical protein
MKQDVLSPLFFSFALEYAIRNIQENQEGLDSNGAQKLLAYADNAKILSKDITITKELY